jgi:hypothetical protein
VQQVVRQLRATGASDKRFENHVTARAYATLGFIAYQHQHISDTRYYFLRAIRHDTQWLRNGGVLSILAESILGKPFIHSVRKMARIRRRDQHQTGAAL